MSGLSDLILGAKQMLDISTPLETIEVVGNNKIIVENTNKILEYKSDIVRLGSNNRIITINGGQLKLNDYSDKNIVIGGIIKSISFD